MSTQDLSHGSTPNPMEVVLVQDGVEANLQKKDELIAQFKNALVQRDVRIGQLELLLAKARVVDEIMETEKIPPPPAMVHQVSPTISAETKGLFQDGWTGTTARLVFDPSPEMGEYLISFWLPRHAVAKSLFVTPDGGDRTELELRPDKTVVYRLRGSSDPVSPARLTLETSRTSAANEKDRRALGVFLLQVVWIQRAPQGWN
jgi:hypothetical protein